MWTDHRGVRWTRGEKVRQALQVKCVHRFPGADARRFLPLTAGIRNAWTSSVESHLGLPVLILGFRGAMFPALGTKCCSDRSY